jgi:beta-xylosidase
VSTINSGYTNAGAELMRVRVMGMMFAPALLAVVSPASAPVKLAPNPIVPGWYADPEIRRFGDRYWIYPTTSIDETSSPSPAFTPRQRAMRAKPGIRPAYLTQTHLDAFSSPDLVHWTKHAHVLDTGGVSWAAYAIWAPSTVQANGRYYLFFGANDVHPGETGGIGVAVADRPAGPFHDLIGHPLIGEVHNGAQPIDPFVFRDADGRWLLYYGGWGHLNVVRLAPDLTRVLPWPDGTTYKEITPRGYVEGSFVVKRGTIYYLMWSEGGWTGPDYRVAYATGPSALGPFARRGVILSQDERVARGAGHHSVVKVAGTRDEWVIAYHRRPLSETAGDHRVLALDHLAFAPDGSIRPVVMTGR